MLCLWFLWFLQDLPDVQELIAEVNAEKYSLQAAAILGEGTELYYIVCAHPEKHIQPCSFLLCSVLVTTLRKPIYLCFRH